MFSLFFIYSSVSKLMADKMENPFNQIVEHSVIRKYSLNKID